MKKAASTFLILAMMTGFAQPVFAEASTSQQVHQQKEASFADLLESQDVDYFLQKAEDFRSKHSAATLEDINHFLKKEMTDRYKHKIDTFNNTLDYPIPIAAQDMNPLEKQLYNSNLYFGLQSLACGKMAKSESEARYTSASLTGGNGDAFRHSFWNAAMVVSTSASWAEQWATAHEDGDPYNDQLNKSMDLTNNYRGRQIGSSHTGMLEYVKPALISDAIQWVNTGKMVRIVSNQIVSTDSSGRL